jgi:hypothetical protein
MSGMVAHAYNPNGLNVAESILRWDASPQTVSGDSWQMVFVMSDRGTDTTAFGVVDTQNGQHAFTISEYVSGVEHRGPGMSVKVPDQSHLHSGTMFNSGAAFPNDFGLQEFSDFYSDGDGIQFFWYGPHTAFQAFSYNLNLPVRFTPKDVAFFFAPLSGHSSVAFKPLSLHYLFVGQQQARPGLAWSSGPNLFSTPLGAVHPASNMCEDIVGSFDGFSGKTVSLRATTS